MNPFLNPLNLLPFLKDYAFGPTRLKKMDSKQISKYNDKIFRKIVRYAFSVPVYRKKYKESNVHLDEIKHVSDITKLPLITKKDLMNNFPDKIIPINYNRNKAGVVSTSGSTGKTVSFYVDFPTLSKGLILLLRHGTTYNFNWRKTRFVMLGNFSHGKADQVAEEIFISKIKPFISSNNSLSMNAFDDIKDIIKKLNEFKPDVILSYPVTFQQLAYFKKKGYADHINPRLIMTGGYVLDEYTRSYVKDAFKCPVVNVYSSAESCADIAFECLDGTWHVNHDFYYLEAVDENMNLVALGETGHIIITRLFGKGTPFVRYTGMDDWVTLMPDHECTCGLRTPILKHGVEGRSSTSIVLPDGRVIPSASFEVVSLILKDLKTYKVTQFQIIQNKIGDIEILLVIDQGLRDIGPSVGLILKKIKQVYEEKAGPDVKITVKEVKEIKSLKGKPMPLVISKVKPEDGFKILEENIPEN